MRAIAFPVALAVFAGAAHPQDIAMKEHEGMRWACGGAGVEERAALAPLRPQANLELLFVTARRGGYLADVEVSVYAADKPSPAFRVTAEGPICLISAPASRYRIEASYGGVKRSQEVRLNTKQSRVVFAFPPEPWDGISASDDEKQQAKAR